MIHRSIRTPGNATHTKSGSDDYGSANDASSASVKGRNGGLSTDDFDIRLQLNQNASQVREAFLRITERNGARRGVSATRAV
jgi:hypothetical protein